MFRFDLIKNTHLTGAGEGIFVDAEIFLRHFVDVRGGAFFGNLLHGAANLKVAVGIVGVQNGERDMGTLVHVGVFAAAFGRVHQDVGSIEIAPDRCHLRSAVGHKRCQAGESFLVEKVQISLGDHNCVLDHER